MSTAERIDNVIRALKSAGANRALIPDGTVGEQSRRASDEVLCRMARGELHPIHRGRLGAALRRAEILGPDTDNSDGNLAAGLEGFLEFGKTKAGQAAEPLPEPIR